MAATFNGNSKATIISCYSPTNISEETELVTFYKELSSLERSIPKHNLLVIGGDMNAQIGKNRNNKYRLHNTSNSNGQQIYIWIWSGDITRQVGMDNNRYNTSYKNGQPILCNQNLDLIWMFSRTHWFVNLQWIHESLKFQEVLRVSGEFQNLPKIIFISQSSKHLEGDPFFFTKKEEKYGEDLRSDDLERTWWDLVLLS